MRAAGVNMRWCRRGFLILWIGAVLVILALALGTESEWEKGDAYHAIGAKRCASSCVEEEPELLPWWRSALEAKAHSGSLLEDSACDRLTAPDGKTMQLTPMCAVGGDAGLARPRCLKQEVLPWSVAAAEGRTRAWCVKRGAQPKCYVENIMFRGGTFFTFGGEKLKMPSTMFAADDGIGPLARYHGYHGNPVREIESGAERRGSSLLSHCKYVINKPTVFMYRVSGHSTFHAWKNNIGPLYDTLHDNFDLGGGGDGHRVFGGEAPIIVALDDKPQHGPGRPALLEALLQHFTDSPIVRASELTESICFARAIIGISSRKFDQRSLRRLLLPNIALQQRLQYLLSLGVGGEYAAAMPRSSAAVLRCLVPHRGRRLPFVVDRWFSWSLRRWQRLPRRPRVLYLSRNHPNITRGRKVVNEADILPALKSAVLALTGGTLKCTFLEEMHYVDQVMEMSRTNILIAPHGGGIANCIWMPPGSVVVEFVAPAGETLPAMYHVMCGTAEGRSALPIKHISFIAEQDPAELEPGFDAANTAWRGNKRLLSNIWMPQERLLKHFARAVKLYHTAWAMAGGYE